MAVNLWRCVLSDFYVPKFYFIRHGHRIRGKPPGVAKSLQQRLAMLKQTDELYSARIDIGLPAERSSRSDHTGQRFEHVKKQKSDPTLEKLSRYNKLNIHLEEATKDWLQNEGPSHIKKIAEHYAIFEHLYSEGYFVPRVHMDISFFSNDVAFPVYYGNIVKPSEAENIPDVTYKCNDNNLWTLTLINLDGHLTESNKEYIHWCVTNIPGNQVHKGDTVVQYMQPIPPKGTGFHRYVFILYKQNKIIDFPLKNVKSLSPLCERSFETREWYSKYQDDITPAGLAFFQSDWDPSLTDFFHHKLNMREPIFEYDFPKPYLKPQKWFPLRQPFNLYMDKYRDPKQIAKEYLLLKLKNEHPFKKPDPPLKYPNAHALPHSMPSWLKLHQRKIRSGLGRINDV